VYYIPKNAFLKQKYLFFVLCCENWFPILDIKFLNKKSFLIFTKKNCFNFTESVLNILIYLKAR
jgi:hypothetical protein